MTEPATHSISHVGPVKPSVPQIMELHAEARLIWEWLREAVLNYLVGA